MSLVDKNRCIYEKASVTGLWKFGRLIKRDVGLQRYTLAEVSTKRKKSDTQGIFKDKYKFLYIELRVNT